MKKVNKTYKFRIYPNKHQKTLLSKHFGCSRFIYNYFLNQRIEQYREHGSSDNYNKQAKSLTELKKQEEYDWLKEVNSQTVQFSLKCLDNSYVNFFKGRTKFPKFKSRKHKNTFTIPQYGRLENGKLKIPKFKLTSGGTLDNTGGDLSKTFFGKHGSVKSETHQSLAGV
jgi:putative transposase